MEKTLRKTMKKQLAVIAAAVLMLSSCGGSPRYHYEVRKDLSVYFKNADTVIEKVRSALVRRDSRIVIEYTSSGDNMQDIDDIVREIMDYAVSETDCPYEGDYIAYQNGGYRLEYSCTENSGSYSYELVITPDLYTDSDQEQKVTEKIGEVTASLDLDSSTSDREKARRVYDYICENVKYDTIHKGESAHHMRSTAYGALIYGHATCQGYAVAVYRLLRESGVPCRVITGTAYNDITGEYEHHAWNIAEIDGAWYNIDATWGSILDSDDYFLVSDSALTAHTRDEKFSGSYFYKSYPMG